MGVGWGEEQQGMSLQGPGYADVHGKHDRLWSAGHDHHIGCAASLDHGGLDLDDLTAHRAECLAGALHGSPESARDGVLTGFGEG
jgi:hypothetical protein